MEHIQTLQLIFSQISLQIVLDCSNLVSSVSTQHKQTEYSLLDCNRCQENLILSGPLWKKLHFHFAVSAVIHGAAQTLCMFLSLCFRFLIFSAHSVTGRENCSCTEEPATLHNSSLQSLCMRNESLCPCSTELWEIMSVQYKSRLI